MAIKKFLVLLTAFVIFVYTKAYATDDVISNLLHYILKEESGLSGQSYKQKIDETGKYEGSEKLISISAYSKRLGDLLLEIGATYGYSIIFGPLVDPNQLVVVDVKKVPIEKAIDIITKYLNYGYTIKDREITILKTVTKTYTIPDVAINVPLMNAEMGGDMVGEGSGGASGVSTGGGLLGSMGGQNLKASITLKKTDDKIDGRTLFENNIKKLLSPDGHYVLDWLSASLMVIDTPRNHEVIERYISNLKNVANIQVAISATITQVNTTNQFRFGVDWDALSKKLNGTVIKTNITTVPSPSLTITKTGADLSAVIKALEEQGAVTVLSNPYVYARNLQPIAIFSGKSVPYIGSIQKTTTGNLGESTTSFSIARAQDGVMLGVKCHVRENGNIDVQIIPILTSVEDFVTFNIEGNTFSNPVSSVQQTLQSVTLKDGETIIIGGVKREKKEISERKVPFISKIPVIGEIFKSQNDTSNNSELVIALKVKIVNQ